MSDSTPVHPIPEPDTQATLPPLDVDATLPPTLADGTPPADAAPVDGVRYRVLRSHARGGLGEVFVALDTEVGREVALKEIQDEFADDPASQGRFLREAEVNGRLEHPSIVPVYGLGRHADGRPYYAMRFIRGETLDAAARRFHEADRPGRDPGERALAFRQLLSRFIAVCNAVAYAHSRGVLHRDIKPANVMLGKFGETLLVDWGLAKVMGQAESASRQDEPPLGPSRDGVEHTQQGAVLGTPAFMAPEQAAGRLDQVGPASDIYSLGATLYVLLTGRAPFTDPNIALLLAAVQMGEYPRPSQVKPGVAPALEAICRKAMALQPGDRYESAAALAGDVEHWLADEPVSAWREPWGVRLARWGRRHRAVVTAAVATVVVRAAAQHRGNGGKPGLTVCCKCLCSAELQNARMRTSGRTGG